MRRLKRVAVWAASVWLLLSASWVAAWTGTITEVWVNPFTNNQIAVIGTSANTDCDYGGGFRYAIFTADGGAAQTQESLNRILSVLVVAKTTGSAVTVVGDCNNAAAVMLK